VVLDHEAPIFSGLAPEAWLDAWLTGGSASDISHCYVGGRRHDRGGAGARIGASPRFARVMRELLA
jgi:hypothetical protein